MHQRIPTILAIVIAILSVSCSTASRDNDRYVEDIQKRIGSNESELVAELGYPDNSYQSAEGDTIRVYSYRAPGSDGQTARGNRGRFHRRKFRF